MSYNINQGESVFFIAKDDIPNMLKTCWGTLGAEPGTGFSNSKDSLIFFDKWNYIPQFDFDNNIVGLELNSSSLGVELAMFEKIAKYVKAGSYIYLIGEDGTHFRYVFDGVTCKEVEAKIVWEY